MSKITIIDGNSNEKENVKLLMVKGEQGYSAYEIAVKNGYTGTEEEWVNSFLNSDNYYNKDEVDAKIKTNIDIVNLIYPVGSIYMSVNSTSPATLFGGTWEEWGTGRVPVGVDTTDEDFDTVEETGGSKYIQAHRHSFKVVRDRLTNSGGDLPKANDSEGENDGWSSFYSTDDNNLAVGEVVGATTGNSGNLQPYITCYMWKRTA